VLEILPLSVSKGSAIQKIVLLPGFIGLFPVYLGDDITDESAFLLLQGHGLTIKVGRPGTETAASHYLPDTKAVRHFLSLLAAPLEDS
jgi:trehalose-phosphatase